MSDLMAGEKGRIGLIVPANNAAIEYDFWNMAPKGVTIHSTRMPSIKGDEPISDTEIANFKKDLSNAVKLLSQVSNVIVYGRTYGSRTHPEIIKSVYDNIIIPEYEAAKSLHKLNAKNIFVLTPYNKWRTKGTLSFFKSDGFNIVGYDFMNKIRGIDIANIDTDTIIKFLNRNLGIIKNSDAVYLASTALSTSDSINEIAKYVKIPVITENISAINETLKKLKLI